MPQISWVTDPHLNFLKPEALHAFTDELAAQCRNALLITGDIAESPSITPLMDVLDQKLSCPIYFVLGNHDYYFGNIDETRRRVRAWSHQSRRSHWLPDTGVISLSEQTALIGHGAWSDGRAGDFMGSQIHLNDYRHIADLVCDSKQELHHRLIQLATEAADYLEQTLKEALRNHNHVILGTHSPPFAEACWHDGRAEINEWTPHFTCVTVGERLIQVMKAHPNHTLEVVCGHTHGQGEVSMLPNLRVLTGGAEYLAPELQHPILFH